MALNYQYLAIPCKNAKLAEILTHRAEELGYKGKGRENEFVANDLALPIYGYINSNVIMYCDISNNDSHKIVGTLEKFLYTDEYKFKPEKLPITVILNTEYTAKVSDKEIKVGCTSFPIEKLNELVQAVEKYKNQ